ncbi:hypothetical protein V22_25090 [Calycomorphotria hydatis]|uniref:Uncharacterized protein n=1 Tax=Calycomorphotria hydatis TaxID=2528027 RepID=A0A517TA58_9PLAN|nr:hypothetical protein V22_25090 [Calycomorphotria hydatis]
MSGVDRILEPSEDVVAIYHQAKYQVFLKLQTDQLAYRDMMCHSY